MEKVKSILSTMAFRASYRIEDVRAFKFTSPFIGIPMVCFCDIPLKFVNAHSEEYGQYSIGLSKTWAIKKQINPLHYLVELSSVTRKYQDLIRDVNELLRNHMPPLIIPDVNQSKIPFIMDSIVRLTAFTKPYENSSSKFYSEREWRFVPDFCEMPFLENDSNCSKDTLNAKYHINQPDYLEFTVEDIQHIIVPSKSDVNKMISEIFKLPITEDFKLQLVQKINDLETINNDF